MIIHHLMLGEFRGNEWFGNQILKLEFSEGFYKNLDKIKSNDIELDKVKSILISYFLYMKRRVIGQNHFLWEPEELDLGSNEYIFKKRSDAFSLINIMRMAAVFRNDLYYFGRYAK